LNIMGSRLLGVASLGVALVALAPAAQAETSTQNRAAAEVLFNEAGQLFRQGNYAAACEKLASSQKLDPAVGTQLNLARCYEKIGKTASAWIAFVDAAATAKAAGQAEREASAREGASRLESLVPKLLIQVPEATLVEGLEITRNGEPVPQDMWNVESPTDPGDHEIKVKAPHKVPWSATVHLEAKKLETISVPPLEAGPAESEPGAAPSGLGTQRILALVSAGVGVGGLAAGTVFGLGAKSALDDANKTCSGSTCNDQPGLDANETAQQKATLSTIFFSAGAACLVGGAILWFTAPSGAAKPSDEAARAGVSGVAPLLGGDTRGLLVEGRF